MSNPYHATTTLRLTCPNRVEAEVRHHLGDLRGGGLVAGGPAVSALRPYRHHPSVLDDLFLQEPDRMRAAGMAGRSWLPAKRRAAELGAQSRTDVWSAAFPGIGEPGCAPTTSGRPHTPCFGRPRTSWKGTGVFLLFGPAYLRKDQVKEILGVDDRQIAAWSHAGLLYPQPLFPFPGGYGYRRREVIRLANIPGPVATWVREQMYRERRERRASVNDRPRQAHPATDRAAALNSAPRDESTS